MPTKTGLKLSWRAGRASDALQPPKRPSSETRLSDVSMEDKGQEEAAQKMDKGVMENS